MVSGVVDTPDGVRVFSVVTDSEWISSGFAQSFHLVTGGSGSWSGSVWMVAGSAEGRCVDRFEAKGMVTLCSKLELLIGLVIP